MNLEKKRESFLQNINILEEEYLKTLYPLWVTRRSRPDKVYMFDKIKDLVKKGDFYFSDKLYQILQEVVKYTTLKLEKARIHFTIELISELEDLLASIIYGYYSYDNISYTEKLIQFFDLILTLDDIIGFQIIYDFEDKDIGDYYPYDYDEYFYNVTRDRFHDIFSVEFERKKDVYFSVQISNKKLKITTHKYYDRDYGIKTIKRKAKEFNDKEYKFILNQNKVKQDNVLERQQFNTHKSNFYYSKQWDIEENTNDKNLFIKFDFRNT